MYYSATNLAPFQVFKLKRLHEFYQSYLSTAKLKILEIGTGPSIANIISAGPYMQLRLFSQSILRPTVQHCCSGSTMIQMLLIGHMSSNTLWLI